MTPLWLLVLDDSAPDLYLMTAAFENYPDVRITVNDQAPAALRWLEDQAARQDLPDLVILDLHMPMMDGVEWLRMLRRHPQLQELPILLYSLTPMDRQLTQVGSVQVSGCWKKSTSFEEMELQADALWRIWQEEGRFTAETLRRAET